MPDEVSTSSDWESLSLFNSTGTTSEANANSLLSGKLPGRVGDSPLLGQVTDTIIISRGWQNTFSGCFCRRPLSGGLLHWHWGNLYEGWGGAEGSLHGADLIWRWWFVWYGDKKHDMKAEEYHIMRKPGESSLHRILVWSVISDHKRPPSLHHMLPSNEQKRYRWRT